MTTHRSSAPIPLPGSPDAAGCLCPTVANIGYRMGIDPLPVVNPECAVHGTWRTPGSADEATPDEPGDR